MSIKSILLLIIIIVIAYGGLLLVSVSLMKRSRRDWGILEDLEERSKYLKTKEEIEIFHKEFVEKANKIDNQYIQVRLSYLNGYLNGLYQQFNRNYLK